jgi:hypothetical protein
MEDAQMLWTVKIQGPGTFSFQAPGSPSVDHYGGSTVTNLVLRKTEIGELKVRAAEAGCVLTAWPVDGQSEEQAQERNRFVGMGEEDRVWPSVECPTCPWFDPLQEGSPCGLDSYPSESIEVLRESEPHRRAEEECPVRN